MHLYNHIARELLSRVPSLHYWAATNGKICVPEVFQSETLTVPLRCAPSVLEEVTKGIKNTFGICGYSTGAVPSPFDGPNVIRLHHCSSSHLVRWPLDCEQCGHDIAAELKKLGVGIPGRYIHIFYIYSILINKNHCSLCEDAVIVAVIN